jgi:release factor glutamine methyltransferase
MGLTALGDVYEPSEDSYLLARAALLEIKEGERFLDIGTGSGIIASSLLRLGIWGVGTDISPQAVKCARLNGIEVIRADLFHGLKGKFDLIIFNPPYLPTSEDERNVGWINRALDGGADGRTIIYRFLDEARDYLRPRGRIMLVVSSLTGISEIKNKMVELGFQVYESLRERFFFEEIVVLVGRLQSSNSTSAV